MVFSYFLLFTKKLLVLVKMTFFHPKFIFFIDLAKILVTFYLKSKLSSEARENFCSFKH